MARQTQGDLGAARAYGLGQGGGFQNLGGILSNKIKSAAATIGAAETQRRDNLKREEEKAGLMVEGFMNSMPDDMDLTAIPEEDQPMISNFLMSKKDEYVNYANIAGAAKVGSPEKLEAMSAMKSIGNQMSRLKQQYDSYGSMKTDYLQDFKKKNLSTANASQTMIDSANIFTGGYKRQVDANGNLSFIDPSGNTTLLGDVKQPFEKAWKEADMLNDQLFKLHERGVKLDDSEREYFRGKFDKLIDDAGIEGLQSIAFDNLVGGKSFITKEERKFIEALNTNDPEELIAAKAELKEIILDRIINVADSQANSGFDRKQRLINEQEAKIKAKEGKDKIDFRSMIVSSGPNNKVKYTTTQDPVTGKIENKASSVNNGHKLNKDKEETYRRAVAMAGSDLIIANINATDATEDKPANSGTIDGGFHLFDKNNDKKAGPFYTEEQFASYLNDLQK